MSSEREREGPGSAALPLAAARAAIDRTRDGLFPFAAGRWLGLGALALLDRTGPAALLRLLLLVHLVALLLVDPASAGRATAWAVGRLGHLLPLAAAAAGLGLTVTAAVLWLNARATFVYLHDVAAGRVEIAAPWRRLGRAADGYFAWQLGLTVAILAALGALWLLGLEDLLRLLDGRASLAPVAHLAPLAAAAALLTLAALGLTVALRDLAAPIQVADDASCGTALGRVLALARREPGLVAMYLLLKLTFAVALVLVEAALTVMTCGLGGLPVVSQTLLQPLHYFDRAWSLALVERLGHSVEERLALAGEATATSEE
jgi:hypothetical protein